MAKYKEFFNNLISTLNRYDTTDIKVAIGDSTNNHRTATVRQVIRFLSSSNSSKLRNLGIDLESAYETLYDELIFARVGLARSDAFDINEFIVVYGDTIMLGGDISLRKSLSKQFIAA